MFFRLIKLQYVKTMRSVSLGRKVIAGVLLAFFGVIIMASILALGFTLTSTIEEITGLQDVTPVLNTYIIYFFLMEIMYRFFLQKISVIELEHFLHLPIRR